ncbi:MAG: hypothetical protein ABSB49_03035 [Polyangia bacterium]
MNAVPALLSLLSSGPGAPRVGSGSQSRPCPSLLLLAKSGLLSTILNFPVDQLGSFGQVHI